MGKNGSMAFKTESKVYLYLYLYLYYLAKYFKLVILV